MLRTTCIALSALALNAAMAACSQAEGHKAAAAEAALEAPGAAPTAPEPAARPDAAPTPPRRR